MVYVEVVMKLNFKTIGTWVSPKQLSKYICTLARVKPVYLPGGFVNEGRKPPEGYEDYVCVDVLGQELLWMNKHFPANEYTWYHWYESIFLVTPEMATFLALRWR